VPFHPLLGGKQSVSSQEAVQIGPLSDHANSKIAATN
jgi:hypothetical protein